MLAKSLIPWAFRILLAIGCISGAQAQTCTATSASIAFGIYDPSSATNLDSTGSVKMTCDRNFNVVLSMNAGNGAGASYSGGLKMTRAGGATLVYNLYANSARTQKLGDGTGGSVTLAVVVNKTKTQSVWGRIPGSQSSVMAGSYTDTVVATITY